MARSVQDLIQLYPSLYAMNCTWGIECNDGWYDLLDGLSKAILELKYGTYVRVVQVKEKFGTLRYYFHISLDLTDFDAEMELRAAVDKLVDVAEAVSLITCEMCGAPGKMQKGSWMYVSCEEHVKNA